MLGGVYAGEISLFSPPFWPSLCLQVRNCIKLCVRTHGERIHVRLERLWEWDLSQMHKNRPWVVTALLQPFQLERKASQARSVTSGFFRNAVEPLILGFVCFTEVPLNSTKGTDLACPVLRSSQDVHSHIPIAQATAERPPVPFSSQCLPSHRYPLLEIISPSVIFLPVLQLSINGIILYISLHAWLFSLIIMLLRLCCVYQETMPSADGYLNSFSAASCLSEFH